MTEQAYDRMRQAMVASQLRTTGVADSRVIAAMGEVPRERFVPTGRSTLAYADALLSLGNGRFLNPPMSLGKLLDEARPLAGDRALLIGAATGYSAAVLARLVASVTAVESDPDLVAHAKQALAGTAVALIEGDLAEGHPEGAPYDLILIDGAVEFIPDSIIKQLEDGGRLAAAILDDGVSRLSIGRRAGDGFGTFAFADSDSAILPGFEKPRTFSF